MDIILLCLLCFEPQTQQKGMKNQREKKEVKIDRAAEK